MKVAYVDTSCLVAIAFGEKGATALGCRLEGFDELLSSNLLEAELWASFIRENVEPDASYLDAIGWILPNRPLSQEMSVVLAAGYLSGADLWHLACALYVVDRPQDMSFVTLDSGQWAVAEALGFAT